MTCGCTLSPVPPQVRLGAAQSCLVAVKIVSLMPSAPEPVPPALLCLITQCMPDLGEKPSGPQFLCAPLCSQLLESGEISGPVRRSREPAASTAGLSAGWKLPSCRRRGCVWCSPSNQTVITASSHLQPNINNEHSAALHTQQERFSARLCLRTASGCL